MDRQKVKDFFETKPDNTGTFIVLAAVSALIGLAWFPGFLAAALFGWLAYREKTKLGDFSELEAVRYFKMKDTANLLNRAFQKANIDIDELVDFEASDMMDFDELADGSSNVEDKLRKKSLILLGIPIGSKWRLKAYKIDGRFAGYEVNPWKVTILFLTPSQLVGYEAELDLVKGDLNSEQFHRIFLKDIVQIGVNTTSKRTEIEKKDRGDFAKEIREKLGDGVEEVVERHFEVNISKTDGHSFSIPIGAPEMRDGKIGALDMETDDEDARYMRIAQEMSQRIDEMKRGLPAG